MRPIRGNSRAGHISKLCSWGQQLLQNRNIVLVTFKSCFLHPYRRQHEQSRAFPKANHPAVCMEELNSSPDCIALWQPVLASAPLTLVTSQRVGTSWWDMEGNVSLQWQCIYIILHSAFSKYMY